MDEINHKHHRNITISKRMTDYAPRKNDPTETYLVLAIEMNDGSHLLSSVARRVLADLERQIKRVEKDKYKNDSFPTLFVRKNMVISYWSLRFLGNQTSYRGYLSRNS